MTRQANCVISAQRTLPLPPPHLGPLTIIIGPPFPMRHECVYFVNCANMCHDPSRLLFRSCAENCSGRATDRTTRSLSLSCLLVLGNIFLTTTLGGGFHFRVRSVPCV